MDVNELSRGALQNIRKQEYVNLPFLDAKEVIKKINFPIPARIHENKVSFRV